MLKAVWQIITGPLQVGPSYTQAAPAVPSLSNLDLLINILGGEFGLFLQGLQKLSSLCCKMDYVINWQDTRK